MKLLEIRNRVEAVLASLADAGTHINNTYVLYIKYDNKPPRVAVFDTLDEAEGSLDAFEVSLFDPPYVSAEAQDRRRAALHAQIFKCCTGDVWGIEIKPRKERP